MPNLDKQTRAAVQQTVRESLTSIDAFFPRWLNSKAASAYLGISHFHLAKLRERRTGPRYYKFGTHVSYDREDLDVFMRSLPCHEPLHGPMAE